MNIMLSQRQIAKLGNMFISLCLLASSTNVTTTVEVQTASPRAAAASGCSIIYNGNNGWTLEMCTTDPAITTPMQVLAHGVSKGNGALVRIYHQSQNRPGAPQVAILL